MPRLLLIPQAEFDRIARSAIDRGGRLSLLADMCRANTLMAVKRAGSGHLGSSLSAMDIVVWLYFESMNTASVGVHSQDRDVYFSSKGHDCPGLYSVLFARGMVSQEKLLALRRYGGLDGHPDVGIPGVEANSGSLGMGISKAKGMAWAKRYTGHGGRVVVMLGDGELQEGQIFEALQTTIHQRITNLTVVVDHNKVQSDKPVCEIIDLGNLAAKLSAFGWRVVTCDGHDFTQLEQVFRDAQLSTECPTLIIAHTIKGRGISFMEHPYALAHAKGLYPWHAGAPDDASFQRGHEELCVSINARLMAHQLGALQMVEVDSAPEARQPILLLGEPVSQAAEEVVNRGVTDEYVSKAFGQVLIELGAERTDLVVLDADLASDCKIRGFEERYPDRFIENGIAEQDMVSMAGGLARMGLLPVVNSFASFLASRANEQIYNNSSERTKIIYVCHYAGIIPAGPGKSHQSIRDISLLGALPNMTILEPCNAEETRWALQYCVREATENCALRLIIGPSPRRIELPHGYVWCEGQGAVLREGADGLLFAYGPVMLHEALVASELLVERGVHIGVVNMPWLNRIDSVWLASLVQSHTSIFVIDDHAPIGGLHSALLAALSHLHLLQGRHCTSFGVEGYPACGTPREALRHHRLDGSSLAERMVQALEGKGIRPQRVSS